jgi:hypothetical protein
MGIPFSTNPQWGGVMKVCIETYSLVKFMFWLVVADEKVRLD